MKILSLHCDYIKFKALKKAVKEPEELNEDEKKEHEVKEPLVIMIAVEKPDETDGKKSIKELVSNILDLKEKVNAERIVLYPYAHLSSNLASLDFAGNLLKETEKELKNKKIETFQAPFGYYKTFELKCKGHPLSELSREIVIGEGNENKAVVKGDKDDETDALKSESKIESYWKIMTPEGKMYEIKNFNFDNHKNLKKFSFYEKEKSRAVVKEPAHIKIMKRLELVDYEPGSDSGNLRYYPKGRLMKALIEQYVNQKVWEYGGMEIESPIMYDVNHPTLSKYLQRFPARQYQIESDKRTFFLRFAACFGQFLMAKDAQISYKQLPIKLYELTRYSFRKEQSGELAGLRRLRSFTMPDVHAFCKDMGQAVEEFRKRFDLSLNVLEGLGLNKEDVELAIRFTREFYEKNELLIKEIVNKFGKPVLIEMWDERFFYFTLKYELNFVDSVDKAAALSTDQIDVENAERYGIKFIDKDDKKKFPLILHCSPSGAVERVMYALLEKAEMSGSYKIPYWLSPTQLRILPISEKFNKESIDLANELTKENIRVDVDDRNETSKKKIVESEKEWIPFTIFVGEKELKENKFSLRERGKKELQTLSKEEIKKILKGLQKEMPWRPLPLPLLLTKRINFV